MKLQGLSYGVGIFAAIASVAEAKARFNDNFHSSRRVVPGAYIAEFEDGHNDGHVFLAHFNELATPNITVRQNFQSDILNGVSFTVDTDHTIYSIRDAPGIKTLWPVLLIPGPDPIKKYAQAGGDPTVNPKYETMHNLTGVTKVHDKLHVFGKGVKVGVIDTGLYYKHPAFGVNGKPGCYKKPGCRVQYGYDLVGDAYSSKNPKVKPDNDPFDNCSDESHGTHVAGIIGANAANIKGKFKPIFPFVGVAPEATLGAYRVFGCDADFTSNDIITQAILLAAKDGMDVINLSLGGGSAWHEELQDIIANRVGKKGHIVLSAMGNDGGTGMWVGGNPGLAQGGFGVASIDNLVTLSYIIKDSKGKEYAYGLSSAFGKPFPNLNAKIIVNDPNAKPETTSNDGCSPLTYKAHGAVVIFQQGSDCTSAVRCANANTAGAAGCLVYANTPGSISILGDSHIPGGGLTQSDGQAIVALVKAKPDTIFAFTDKQALFHSDTAGTPSSFTSWAMDPELQIKPNMAAIGGNVYSTLSPKASAGSGYGTYSGTSMATPYLAGSIALYISTKGKPSFDLVKTHFQNSAVPAISFGRDWYASVAQQGAGLVNVYDTILSKTIVTPSELALNDTINMKKSYKIRIYNKYSKKIDYHLTHQPSATVYNKALGSDMLLDFPIEKADYATVSFSQKKLTIGAGKSQEVTITFKAPKASDPRLIPIFSGYIAVAPQIKGASFARVTYAGLKGSWKSAPIFNKVDKQGGFTVGLYDSTGKPIKSGTTYNLSKEPITALLVLSTPSRLVYAYVVSSKSAKSLGYLEAADGSGPLYINYAGRNSESKGQSSSQATPVLWAGGVSFDSKKKATLPAGQYKVIFRGLKHFGNPKKPSDFESYESPLFKIAY